MDQVASFASKDEHCAYLEITGELYRMVMGVLRNEDFGKNCKLPSKGWKVAKSLGKNRGFGDARKAEYALVAFDLRARAHGFLKIVGKLHGRAAVGVVEFAYQA